MKPGRPAEIDGLALRDRPWSSGSDEVTSRLLTVSSTGRPSGPKASITGAETIHSRPSDGHAEADVEPDVQRPNRISGGRRDKAAPMEKESEHVTAKHAQPASCHGAGGTSAGDDSPMKSFSFGRPSPVFAKRFAASRKAITLAVALIEFA